MNRAVPVRRAHDLGAQNLSMPPWVSRLSAIYDSAATVIASSLLGLMVIVIAVQIVFRYLLDRPLSWSEELSTYMFSWVIFLGATMTIRRKQAPALRLIVERLPTRATAITNSVCDVLALAIGVVVLFNGVKYFWSEMAVTSNALRIPVAYPAAIMPLTGIGLVLHYLSNLAEAQQFVSQLFRNVVIAAAVATAMLGLPYVLGPESTNQVLLLVLVMGFLIGLPVALVLILAALFALIALQGPPLTILPERLFDSSTNFLLMAVPVFIFTGAIMQTSGLGSRLIEFSSALVGRFRGGLLYTNVISSAIFADISGSSAADTAAIGSVMLPEMIARGYERRFSTALQAASGTLGVLVPPSITALVYAWIADVSVVDMFLATILPAILMGLSFCVLCYFKARKEQYPREKSLGPREVGYAFGRGVWALAAPAIILGGIVTGVVTAPESGVIAVGYTIVISTLLYRTMDLAGLRATMVAAVLGTARVMFILGGSLLLGWVLTYQGIPQTLTSTVLGLSHNPLVLLILLNFVLILIHEVLETSATLVLVVPLVLPLFIGLGVSPIQVGIVFLMNSALGIVTPPSGILLYIAAPITGIRVEALFRAIIPFLVLLLVDLAVVVFFPAISTIVPALVHHR